ncbi:RNA-guided endonuclease TnpB family protein, partial [Geobacillus sp. AYS3]
IELVYDRGLWLCLSYEDGKEPKENKNQNRVAIDPGEIHTIAAVCENGESLIITGRKIRSIHRLRNKKLKELQKLMSRCKKGSKQWKKYNRAKQYVLSKSEAQLKDALHKTTRQFVRWCLENQVKEVVIGDVEGVQRNTKKKRNKKTNQKLSNWSFGKLYDYLEYKLNAEGIQLEKKDESYTSQTCPVCGKKNKSSSRNYSCSCGYRQHRDIHGAMNLFTKVYYGEIRPLEFTVKPFTYRRIA